MLFKYTTLILCKCASIQYEAASKKRRPTLAFYTMHKTEKKKNQWWVFEYITLHTGLSVWSSCSDSFLKEIWSFCAMGKYLDLISGGDFDGFFGAEMMTHGIMVYVIGNSWEYYSNKETNKTWNQCHDAINFFFQSNY